MTSQTPSSSVSALQRAICADLGALPGVATCQPYAGELEESARATLRVPALLLAVREWLPGDPDPGTEQVEVDAQLSLYAVVRHAAGADARASGVDALVEMVLPRLRLARWGLVGVGVALFQRVVPHWGLEPKGLAVREVRWSQVVRLGVSIWDGDGVVPSDVRVGWSPLIGDEDGTADDYEAIAP